MASQREQEAVIARRASHAAMYQRGPYRVLCPRCGADAGEPCVRPDGERRPAHIERWQTPDPQETLFNEEVDE